MFVKRIIVFSPCGPKKELSMKLLKGTNIFGLLLCCRNLKHFFFNCFLPELVVPRHTRNMPIRNPDYIIKAQNDKKHKRLKFIK